MNVLFAIKTDIYSAQEPLGILYLSSILKQNGHKAFLSDSSLKNITKLIKDKQIGLFAISCMNTDFRYYLNLSKNVKKRFPKIPIIWGGPTPTFNPEIINERGIDVICRGEGENALLELVDKLDQKQSINKIHNLWVKKKMNLSLSNKNKPSKNIIIYKNSVRPLITNLDNLPFPDRSLSQSFYQFRYSPIKFVHISRGCPFNCSFCFNHQLHKLYQEKGKIIRVRSVDNVIAELEELKVSYNTKFFYFQDDVFPFEDKWLSEFTKKYNSKIKIPFTMLTSVSLVNKKFVTYLKKAGCISINLAIECGNEKIRREVLNKPISNEQIIEACKIIKNEGIAISAFNMVGIPFSTFEDELRTLDLNLKVGVDTTCVSFCLPFLNTKLGKVARDANLISSEGEILSWFEKIPLKIENREKIEKFGYLFTIIILFPCLRPCLPALLKIPLPKFVLKLSKDILTGYSFKKKIVPVKASYKQVLVTAFYFILKRFTK